MTGDHPLDSTSVIMVGERLATSPGALSSAAGLAVPHRRQAGLGAAPGRRPRRASRPAASRSLLPGGRPVARRPGARRRGHRLGRRDACPRRPGRDADQIVAAVIAGELGGLVVGGVDPDDTADPAAFRAALDAASFVVALELRETDVTRAADVVFPVAAVVDKAGTFVTWEGRPRWFDAVFTNPQALPDSRVLAGIAEELGRPLGFRTVSEVRAQMEDLGPWDGDRAAHRRRSLDRQARPRPVAQAPWPSPPGSSCSTTARCRTATTTCAPPPATRSPGSARPSSTACGDTVTLTGDRGEWTLPAEVADLPDGVVWVPANNAGNGVLADLASPGSRVTVKGATA